MSIPLTINGAVFEYPVDFDENWGVDATGWAQAVTNGMLQMAGGSFPLTADVNFGPNFGVVSQYFSTRSTLPATSGTVRLSSADAGVAWRNNANNGNLILTTNASDQLLYNGNPIATGGGGAVTSITGTANQIIASSPTGAVTLSAPQDIAPASSPTFNSVTHTTNLILKDSALANLTMRAPTTLSTPWILTLPVDDGTSGQVLSTDGSGNTSWINAAGGGTINSGTAPRLAYYATNGTTLSDNSHLYPQSTLNVTHLIVEDVSLAGVILSRTASSFQGRLVVGNSGATDQILLTDVTNSRTILEYRANGNTVTTTGAWSFNTAIDMNSHQINEVTDPTLAQDAATKNYVDTTAILGSGTTNTVAKFTAAKTIGNGTITDSGGTVTVPGNVNVGASGASAAGAQVNIGTQSGGGTYGMGLAWSGFDSPKFYISLSPTLSTLNTTTTTLFPLIFDGATQLGRMIEMRVCGVDLTTVPANVFSAIYIATFRYSSGAGIFQQVGTTQTIYSQSNLANAPTFTFVPQAASTIINFRVAAGNNNQTKWQATAFIHETHNA